MKVELKNVKMRVPQYLDSIQFQADLFINDTHVGAASNNGEGGSCSYEGYTSEGIKLIREAEAYFKSLPPYAIGKVEEKLILIEQSLELCISHLSDRYYKDVELNRMIGRGFVFGQNQIYQWLKLGKSISHYLKTPEGENFLIETFKSEVIPRLQKGDVVYNTNLPTSITDLLFKKQLVRQAVRKVSKSKSRSKKRL